MSSPVVEVQVRAVVPTSAGYAVFIGNPEKVFVMYVDHHVGMAIASELRRVPRERPQTHDLVHSLLKSLEANVERVIINDFKEGVFYARLILVEENELHERKIVELDARPSDGLAVGLRQKCPLYVAQHVWDNADDMTEILMRMEDQALDFDASESEDEEKA